MSAIFSLFCFGLRFFLFSHRISLSRLPSLLVSRRTHCCCSCCRCRTPPADFVVSCKNQMRTWNAKNKLCFLWTRIFLFRQLIIEAVTSPNVIFTHSFRAVFVSLIFRLMQEHLSISHELLPAFLSVINRFIFTTFSFIFSNFSFSFFKFQNLSKQWSNGMFFPLMHTHEFAYPKLHKTIDDKQTTVEKIVDRCENLRLWRQKKKINSKWSFYIECEKQHTHRMRIWHILTMVTNVFWHAINLKINFEKKEKIKRNSFAHSYGQVPR